LPRLKLAFAKAWHKKPARNGRFFFTILGDLMIISIFLLAYGIVNLFRFSLSLKR